MKKSQSFTKPLLSWYKSSNIQMPWRGETDLYKIWLSEIMLQQTQVKTVIPYYNRWISEFPNIESVAKADENKILKLWEGLGYYSRARNFHHACKTVMKKFEGNIPENADKFAELKGVGPYTVAAVQSIGFNRKMAVTDGNVKRVISRYLGLKIPIHKVMPNINIFLNSNIKSTHSPGKFNQALMDLGRTVCKPKNPQCEKCPVNRHCIAFDKNLTDKIPFVLKKKKIPHYKMAVGLIWNESKFLMGQRKSDKMLGGLWEMPGFRYDLNHTPLFLKQSLKTESGLSVKMGDKIATAKHVYSHFSIELDAYHCEYISGTPKSSIHSKWEWTTKEHYNNLPIHKANHKLFNSIFGY